MKKNIFLLLLVLLPGWTMMAQTALAQPENPNKPEELHSPAFYATTSLIPGLGQFLLGESRKGTMLVLASAGSALASVAGYTAVSMRQRPLDEPQLNKTVTTLWGVLAIAGSIGWIGTEIWSVTDACRTAKQKRSELVIVPTVSYTSDAVPYAPGIGISFRF